MVVVFECVSTTCSEKAPCGRRVSTKTASDVLCFSCSMATEVDSGNGGEWRGGDVAALQESIEYNNMGVVNL